MIKHGLATPRSERAATPAAPAFLERMRASFHAAAQRPGPPAPKTAAPGPHQPSLDVLTCLRQTLQRRTAPMSAGPLRFDAPAAVHRPGTRR